MVRRAAVDPLPGEGEAEHQAEEEVHRHGPRGGRAHAPTETRRACQLEQVDELLELAGLDPAEFRGRYPRELSGGQRQRVGVARALAADPPILLMDEPFGALDPLTRAEIQQEFVRLQDRLKKTVVFVTHDIREALTVGTRITLLEAGRLAGVYSPQEFLSASDPLAAQFVETLRVGKMARGS